MHLPYKKLLDAGLSSHISFASVCTFILLYAFVKLAHDSRRSIRANLRLRIAGTAAAVTAEQTQQQSLQGQRNLRLY